jgi:hypothetical protein
MTSAIVVLGAAALVAVTVTLFAYAILGEKE